MAGRTPSPGLTEAELRIMDALWTQAPASVAEVTERLSEPRPAYNSVLTILRILERKGYVTHDKDGRRFTYSPVVDQQQARGHALTSLLGRFFGGSEEMLVMHLLGREKVDTPQLDRLRTMLDAQRTPRRRKAERA